MTTFSWRDYQPFDPNPGRFELSSVFEPSQYATANAWKVAEASLLKMYVLDSNWDGLNADAPMLGAIRTALASLEGFRAEFPAPSRITLTPAGSILFEWQSNGYYLEAEFDEPSVIEFMFRGRDGRIEHWQRRLSMSPVSDGQIVRSVDISTDITTRAA